MAHINWDEIDPIDERRIDAIEDAFQRHAGDAALAQGTPRKLAEIAVAALNELLETEMEVRAWAKTREELTDEDFRRIALLIAGSRLEALLMNEAADQMRAHHADAVTEMNIYKSNKQTIAQIVQSERAATFKDAERSLRRPV